MGAIVILTTVETEEQANTLAEELVARRQSCCVNIFPGVRSTYRWEGKICRDSEHMLMIKTVEDEFEQVAATIRELHGYDLPEILAFSVHQGDPKFLTWITDCLDKDADFGEDEEAE